MAVNTDGADIRGEVAGSIYVQKVIPNLVYCTCVICSYKTYALSYYVQTANWINVMYFVMGQR